MPFAIVRQQDGVVIGIDALLEPGTWAWPTGHPLYGAGIPDACEIGYTWLARAAIRTGANT